MHRTTAQILATLLWSSLLTSCGGGGPAALSAVPKPKPKPTTHAAALDGGVPPPALARAPAIEQPRVLFSPPTAESFNDLEGIDMCANLGVDAKDSLYFMTRIKHPYRHGVMSKAGYYYGRLRAEGGYDWLSNLRDPVTRATFGAAPAGLGLVVAAWTEREYGRESKLPPGAFLTRIDAAGGHEWQRSVGQSAPIARVIIDRQGNVLTIGSTKDSPADGGAPSRSEIIVEKFDSAGKRLWSKRWPGWLGPLPSLLNQRDPGVDQHGVLDGDDLLVWTYPCDRTGCHAVPELVKLNADGGIVWRVAPIKFTRPDPQTAQRNMVLPAHLAVDGRGRLFAATVYEGPADLNERFESRSHDRSGMNGILMRLGRDGRREQDVSFDVDKWGMFLDGVTVDAAGRVWISGSYRSFIEFDRMNSMLVHPDAMAPDRSDRSPSTTTWFVAQFTDDLEERFSSNVGHDRACGLAAFPSGHIAVSGRASKLLLPDVIGPRPIRSGGYILKIPGSIGEEPKRPRSCPCP